MESTKTSTATSGLSYWLEFTFRLAICVGLYLAVCILGGVDTNSDVFHVGGALMGLLGGLMLQCKMQLEGR